MVKEKRFRKGTCVIRNGSYNAGFSPVSAIMFVNKIDSAKVEAAMQKYLDEKAAEENPETDIELLKRRFMINESERHFMTDDGENQMYLISLLKASKFCQVLIFSTHL